ncbi:MAG TPA: NAD(P)-dependent oxidoreductase [Solirubrobacteraceae bacterium]|nr:NAD(P)-dependent oxidoreductase [Solirubrobacteraceae bacterium]
MDTSPGAKPTIAVLGTGRMGAPIAANLLRAGFPVRVWNRTLARARPLEEAGAVLAGSPAKAAAGADVLLTMLADGAATEEAVTGHAGALTGLQPGAIWIQMGTIGLEWTLRLADEAAHQGVWFVDAPVSGSDGPAREGKLVILAAFHLPDDPAAATREGLQGKLEPIFQSIGRRTVWLGAVGQGSALKLVLNAWLAVLTEQTAEAIAFSEALGLDPHAFVETLSDLPLGSPYATLKANAMLGHHYAPGFALRHAHKDVELAKSAAADRGLPLPLLETVDERWERAIAAGHADEDVAAVVELERVPAGTEGARG